MEELHNELKQFGRVKFNESLARHTTFKIGGPARFFISVGGSEKLANLLNFLQGTDTNYFLVAGGSNILMSDDGYDGLVVKINAGKKPEIRESGAGYEIVAEAGIILAELTNLAAQHGLAGMEWSAGIPGTIGGAIRGNAGAMGKDISKMLRWVEIWRDGEIIRLDPKECGFVYRDTNFKHNKDVILRGCIYLEAGNKTAIMNQMQANLQQRKHSPFPSAGSFFKNIRLDKWKGDVRELPEIFQQRGTVPVGWLSDQLNLRGYGIGGAKIAEDHGNYIINANNATQADVLALVEQMKERIYNKFGVELEPEVEIVK